MVCMVGQVQVVHVGPSCQRVKIRLLQGIKSGSGQMLLTCRLLHVCKPLRSALIKENLIVVLSPET